jgi:hypothetical protein
MSRIVIVILIYRRHNPTDLSGSKTFSIKRQFQHLTMTVSAETCSVVWLGETFKQITFKMLYGGILQVRRFHQ